MSLTNQNLFDAMQSGNPVAMELPNGHDPNGRHSLNAVRVVGLRPESGTINIHNWLVTVSRANDTQTEVYVRTE